MALNTFEDDGEWDDTSPLELVMYILIAVAVIIMFKIIILVKHFMVRVFGYEVQRRYADS